MKKTININISGVAFIIDEDAFQILSNYLDTIKSFFNRSEGRDEIMADIEARIAELLHDRTSNTKQIITVEDIEAVIATLGQPEDFVDEDEESFSHQQTHQNTGSKKRFKRLYRDTDNYIIGGVCEGLGHYVGLDPLWIRAAFLIAFFGFGTGLLLYIILWVIVPKATTTAEKLEMKGEPVNVNNIGKTIEDEMTGVKDKFNDFKNSGKAQEYSKKTQNAVESIFHRLWQILLSIFKILGKLIGVLLILVGAGSLLAFIISLFGVGAAATTLGALSFENFHLGDMNEFVFTSPFELYLGVIGFILLCVIPLFAIIYGGIAILIPVKKSAKGIGFGLLGAWLVGIILCAYTAFQVADQFSNEGTVTQINDLPTVTSDTLLVSATKLSRMGEKHAIRFNDDYLGKITSDSIYMGNVDFNVTRSSTQYFSLLIEKQARGDSYVEAEEFAEKIIYHFSSPTSNALEIDAFFRMSVDNLWRGQQVYVELMVPAGKTIYLDPTLIDLLYDVHNTTNTYDRKMVGHYWTMTETGLMSPAFYKGSSTVEKELEKEYDNEERRDRLKIHSDDSEVEIIIN